MQPGIYRQKLDFERNFTQIPNDWMRDQALSFKAKGLLVYLLSHEVGYRITMQQIVAETNDGKSAVRSAIDELIQAGYLKTERTVQENGYNGGLAYFICEPKSENPTLENPTLENRTAYKNTIPFKKTINNKNLAQNEFECDDFQTFWEHYPRKVGKKAAIKAFEKVADEAEAIIDGAKRYAQDPNLPETQFIPHPATWLNEGRWEDDPLPERIKSREEIAIEQVERSRHILDIDRKHTLDLIAEMREAERRATPPPKCEHGESITRCQTCLNLERG